MAFTRRSWAAPRRRKHESVLAAGAASRPWGMREGATTPLYAPKRGASSRPRPQRKAVRTAVSFTRNGGFGQRVARRDRSELELFVDGHVVAPADVLRRPRQARPLARARACRTVGVGEKLEHRNSSRGRGTRRAGGDAVYPEAVRCDLLLVRRLAARAARPAADSRALDADAIAAYAGFLETAGGRGGGPAAPATRRIYLSMVRALARQIGRHDVAAGVKVPRHKAGPPETLTEVEYENLLRVPDRRWSAASVTTRYCVCSTTADCAPPR